MSPHPLARATRGQSAVDFVIGIAVFLLTLSFVVGVIPDLLSPFAAQETPAVADRAADAVAGDLLAAEPVGALNGTCTAEFFNGTGTSCGFTASGPTTALTGLSDRYSVNVTLTGNVTPDKGTEIACYDGSSVVDCSSGGVRLARGDSPPGDTRTVRTASRVVRLGDETLLLTVRVW